MVNMLDHLITQEAIVQADRQWTLRKDIREAQGGIPEGLKQMIMRQIEQLGSRDRQILEAASVTGAEFSVAAVAAGLEITEGEVEERCEALARRGQFLRTVGVSEWPDASLSTKYRFIHALYREVFYAGIPAARRIHLHHKIGQGE